MSSILITGANRGLGFEFAKQYGADGWQVLAACREPDKAAKLAQLAHTAAVTLVKMDVTDPRSISEAAKILGPRPIDILINGAGIMGGRQSFGDMDYEGWATVFDVNTMGPLRVTQALAEHLARSARKLVVTITSGMGSLADNTSGGWIAYRSSKAAVNMVMRSLAIELTPRGITCVVVNPGWVKTDMGGARAPLTPPESVGALKRLIDTLGPANTGRFYNYDGREYAW